MEITFLGHASFLLKGDSTVLYIDPYHLVGELPKADVILITHPHFDHCSPEDISRLLSEKSIVVSPSGCDVKAHIKEISPGQEIPLKDVIIKAVPAYNIGKSFHPKSNNWVGYLVEIESFRIYHAGDTDLIPEMSDLSVDIALLPIGGTYTMNVNEAVDAVGRIKPKLVIPMHYGDIVGSIDDAHNFCSKSPIECKVLEKGKPWLVEL